MAIGIAHSAAAYTSNADGTVYTSDQTWTPAVGDVIVGFIQASGTTAASPTLAGGLGFTWTLQGSATSNSGANTLYCYTTVAGSAVLITPVFTCSADAATGVVMSFLTFTGADTTTPVVQFKTKDSTTGSNPSITYNSNLSTMNGYAMAVACAANPPSVTAPTNWTGGDNAGHTSPSDGVTVMYRAGGETGATITSSRASINHGIFAIEIAAIAGSAVGTASGIGTATGIGAALGIGVASASGTGMATGIGISTAASPGAAAGIGTATGVGVTAAMSVGEAVGTGAATGVSASTAASPGAAAGTGTAAGVSAATSESVGAASGTGTATGVSAAISDAVGSAAGTGAATGVSVTAAMSVGEAEGTSTAEAVGDSISGTPAVGNATGTSTVTGVGSHSGELIPDSGADIGPGDYSTIRKYFPLRGELKRKRLPKAAIAKIQQVAELQPTPERLENLSATLVPMASPSDLVQMAIRMEMAINEAMEQIYAEALAKEIAAKRVEEAIAKERARVLTEAIAYYLQVLEDDEILLLHII